MLTRNGWFVFALLRGPKGHPQYLGSAEESTPGWRYIVKKYQEAVATGLYSDVGLVCVDGQFNTRRLEEGEIF